MNTIAITHTERGAVLVVSMLFLLVVTVISVVAARNSSFSTKMSSNLQDSYSSFQSAEAGILATILLTRTGNAADDPFDGNTDETPFADIDAGVHPLRQLNDGPDDVDVKVLFTGAALTCPRSVTAFSENLLDCDYYRVESEHQAPQKARTKVDMGVVKSLIGNASR
ncbi:MAG: pilus assembly PilX N-terminal domain-containing protein [Halioglobus sp.]